MRKIGIVELNSTSIKMIFADVLENQSFVCTDKFVENLKIAQEISCSELISQLSIANVVSILKTFKAFCNASDVKEIYSVATSEFLAAKNQRSFFEELYSSTSFRFKILSPEEQLENLYLSIMNSVDASKGVLMSVNGTNLQLMCYSKRNISERETVATSVINLADKLSTENLPTKDLMAKMVEFFTFKFSKYSWLKTLDEELQIVGTNECFASLARLSQKIKRYPFNRLHNYQLTKEDVDKVYEFLNTLEVDSSKKLKGISNDRSDVVACYVCAVKALCEVTNLANITVSENGLAEGVMISKACPPTMDKPITDVLGYSLECLNDCYNKANIKNTKNVNELGLTLFKQLKVLHKLPRTFLKILRAACYLHDCGKRISSVEFERKGFSVILNSDLYGLNHREQILTAFVVASQHLDNFSTAEWVKYKDLFQEGDLEGVRKLAVIIRLAAALDSFGLGKIKDINCDILGDSVIMKTIVESPADAEIVEGMKVAGDFAKAFKKHIEIL